MHDVYNAQLSAADMMSCTTKLCDDVQGKQPCGHPLPTKPVSLSDGPTSHAGKASNSLTLCLWAPGLFHIVHTHVTTA